MEDLLTDTTDNKLGLEINEASKYTLAGITVLAKALAVMAFISLGIGILSSLYTFIKFSGFSGGYANFGIGGSLLTQVITIGISLALNITLLSFSKSLRKALQQNNQQEFNLSMRFLGRYYTIVGILIIVALSFFVLLFLAAMLFRC